MLHRPAVIIGVGGTGQQVLTYLKADLKADNQGTMPDNIRLLCFDTMPEVVEAGCNPEHERTKEIFSYQNERLENLTEFFGLSGNGAPGQRITLTINGIDEPWPDTFEVIGNFIKGKDCVKPDCKIAWSNLQQSLRIRKRIQADGELTASDAYYFQRTDPSGIIMILRAEARKRQNAFHTRRDQNTVIHDINAFRRDSGQAYEDLADLGEMIYHEFEAAVLASARF